MKKLVFREIRDAQGLLILTVAFGVLGTVATLGQMLLLSKIVNQVFLAGAALSAVASLLFLLLAAILLRAVLVWGREITAQEAAIRAKSTLRARLFAHLLRLGPAYCKGERTGELVASATEGIERLDPYVARYLPQIYLSILIPLLIGIAIWPIDFTSSLLLLMTGPIIPLLMYLVGSYAESHTKRQWRMLSRMSAHFLDAVQGLTTLKLFGRSQAEYARIEQTSEEYRQKTMKVLRMAFLSGLVLEFLATFAIALIAVTLGVRLLNSGISFESAFLVLLLAPEFYRPLRELGVHRHAGMEGSAAAERIVEVLETPVPVKATVTSWKCPTEAFSVTMKDVAYTYPDSKQPALHNVNLTLPAQTCTALAGRSGAGKSTLVNLLLRFMELQAGTISVNGISLHELPVETWREYVALVPQRPYLFYGTVRANIRLARPEASDQEVAVAAELAGASQFIAELPQGYDTEIGERGTRLSQGQAQRIAIARAFLKDAPLLILDEPTSSLDPESEGQIRTAMMRLMQNRTVLVIAHRYNTIAQADQVAVMEEGRIVEVGAPGALLAQHGAYYELMNAGRKAVVSL